MGWFWRLVGVEHTARLRNVEVEFASAGPHGSLQLWEDAVQACKDAGIYRSAADAARILVDGRPNAVTRW